MDKIHFAGQMDGIQLYMAWVERVRIRMFIFLDTETTGAGPNDRLCQIAFKPENGEAVSGLFNPGKPISIDAMVVHHITEKMVADKPRFQESDEYSKLKKVDQRH